MTLAQRSPATEVIQTARGFEVELPAGDEIIGRSLRETGRWEEAVAGAIDRHLEPGWTFLDVGAHVGIFALQAALKGNDVIAVEAHAGNMELLLRNFKRAGVRELLEPYRCAVADRAFAGAGYLRLDERDAANPGARYLDTSGADRVPIEELNSLIGACRPEMLKLDIEGLEYRVLKDSPEILAAAQVVIVEAGPEMCARYGTTVEDLVELLRAAGFGVTFADGTPLDARLKHLPAHHYTNLLARRGYVEETPVSVRATTATILLCAWRNLVIETAECLIALRDRGWGYVIKRGDALVSRSRSLVVSSWYRETDEDVFLMIDDDVVFEETGAAKVVELARETHGIACAAYPVKDGGHLACRRLPGQDILFGEGSPPIEIMYPATGFMAVHRDVIDAMVAAHDAAGEPVFPLCGAAGQVQMWPFFDCFAKKQDDGSYEYLSEDYAFGEQARRLGFRVWLDPSVILYHMGTYPYTIENMRDVKNIEVAE